MEGPERRAVRADGAGTGAESPSRVFAASGTRRRAPPRTAAPRVIPLSAALAASTVVWAGTTSYVGRNLERRRIRNSGFRSRGHAARRRRGAPRSPVTISSLLLACVDRRVRVLLSRVTYLSSYFSHATHLILFDIYQTKHGQDGRVRRGGSSARRQI